MNQTQLMNELFAVALGNFKKVSEIEATNVIVPLCIRYTYGKHLQILSIIGNLFINNSIHWLDVFILR